MLRDADIAAEKTCQLNKKRVLKSLYLDILENTNFIVISFFLNRGISYVVCRETSQVTTVS